MSLWAYQSSTAKQSGANAVAVNLPAAAIGDTVYIFCNRGFGTGVTYSATGWSTLVSRTLNNSSAILYRVFDGTEGSTVSVTGSGSSSTYFTSWFTGGPTAANFAASIIATNVIGSSNTTGLNWPALTIGANPNCLVLVDATKQANLTSYNVPATWAGELAHSITSDGGEAFVADYLIQTVAADITTGSWTIGGDSSASHQGIIAAILPAASAAVPFPPMSLGGMNVQVCQ